MEHTLISAARQGDINALYAAIGIEPSILEEFNKVPFSTTPLHMAALVGNTDFAIEIMVLMPSLARKLDQSGYSPMHLALMNGHEEVARELLAMDAELARVKGRERKTPLHYAAERGYTTVLGEMLDSCSDAIKDLTIQRETALHLSVKNDQYEVFVVLVRWIKASNKEEVLFWKDKEGNNVLHLATLRQQLQMIKLLLKGWKVRVNDTGSNHRTALDILLQLPTEPNTREIEGILRRSGARRAQDHPSSISIIINRSSLQLLPDIEVPNEARDAVLVVAGLIITTIFQNGVNPPGGFWQDDSNTSPKHHAGDPILYTVNPTGYWLLTYCNMIGFVLTFLIINDLTRRMPMRYFLQGALISLYICYMFSTGSGTMLLVGTLIILSVVLATSWFFKRRRGGWIR